MSDGTIEIITGRERRRRWGIAEKLRMVTESHAPGACVANVAARHDVSASLLHGWRRLAREGRLRSSDALDFVPVRLTSPLNEAVALQSASLSTTDHGAVAIEVVLPSGGRLLIRHDAPIPMLRAIMAGLRG